MRAAAGLVAVFVCSAVLAAEPAQRTLTFDERVRAQTAIEQVYWKHRSWPKENRTPKPALSTVMSAEAIRAKVENYLKKSNALDRWWHRPITGEQIQAEMDRMAKGSQDPTALRELFAALGNDPFVIAETLARQTLADRLIRAWYANDSRFHGELKQKIEASLAVCNDVGCMKSMGGEYREATWRRRDDRLEAAAIEKTDRLVMQLCADEWNDRLDRLARQLRAPARDLPHRRLSGLEETAASFSVSAVLAQTESEVTIASLVWKKQTFDAWWNATSGSMAATDATLAGTFSLTKLADVDCTIDTWARPASWIEPREFQTAVWTGNEMIVWGGDDGFSKYSTGGRYNPATDSWLATATGETVPSARAGHTAVWTGTEMIVWGGQGSDFGHVNTGGRYNPSTDTWLPTPTGLNVPTVRESHSAVWTGTEMIVWGGGYYYSVNTGGRYNPSTDSWLPTSTGSNVPHARSGHAAVWTGTELIVWGGSGLNDGGRYDPVTDTWKTTATGPSVPAERFRPSAVWTGTEMIVWGGYNSRNSGQYLNSGGRYDPSTDTWQATSTTANVPLPRQRHTAVWTGTEMVVWGGESLYMIDNTGGRYDPATDSWTPISTGTSAPSARRDHTAVWTGTEMIVWGGGRPYDDVVNTGGRYDPSTDSWVSTSTGESVPGRRVFHTAVWTGTEMIVWGGSDDATGGRYDPATDNWAPTSSGDGVPVARYEHTAVWTGTEMIVWGGNTGSSSNLLISGGRYNPSTDTWVPTSTGTDVPEGRSGGYGAGYTAVWTGTEMIVWGGRGGRPTYPALNTGSRYNPSTDSWVTTSTGANVPTGRQGHTAIWTGSEMVVWGGYDNTGGRYDPSTDSWVATSVGPNVPDPRGYHSAVWTGAEMIVWGGDIGFDGYATATGGRYDPSTDGWAPTSTGATAPEARTHHTAVWNGFEMIVWGGQAYHSPDLASGSRYNPANDSWLTTSTGADVPIGRSYHCAVWTGTRMIVWGGSPISAWGTGGSYCARDACFENGETVNCDDNNPCTDDACDPVAGCVHTNNLNACDDANACTSGDTCGGGSCLGTPISCNDSNVCTTDTCDLATGCAFTNNSNACDDGNACTSGDTCGGGACRGVAIVCNDSNACTTDACNAAIGCVYSNNSNSCDDGNACTSGDTCGAGSCHGTAITCDDHNPCTTDSCNPATGCVYSNNSNACNDGNACTRTDACTNGACVGSNPVACGAIDQCHSAGTCDPTSGVCSNPIVADGTACNDHDLCTTGEMCRAGACTPSSSGLNEANPRTTGYYKRLCQGPHSGDQLTDADAVCVGSVARTFAGISTVADLCAELEPTQPNSDPCDRSDDDLMVLALNICRARVCVAQSIDSQCGTNSSVGQSLAESDAILGTASRNADTCAKAKCLDEEINTGRALELNSLTIRRDTGGTWLNWRPPYLNDGTGHPSKYDLWRRIQGSLVPFTKLGATTDVFFVDAASESGAFQYEVTAVMN